ncbi:MAG TPA: hypothetical protein VFG96_08365 [Jiangellaceae bacterium]|nr:hypothetical protein [Jiangellaceae bacterium]
MIGVTPRTEAVRDTAAYGSDVTVHLSNSGLVLPVVGSANALSS